MECRRFTLLNLPNLVILDLYPYAMERYPVDGTDDDVRSLCFFLSDVSQLPVVYVNQPKALDTQKGFFRPEKNPTSSAGFETANLGTKGQHATSRPPKPLH